MSTSAPSSLESASPLRQFARRHPVTLYLLLVFGLGVPLMFVPMLAARGVIPGGSLPAAVGLDTERAAALLLTLGALLPAALIVTALEGGRSAVAALFRRMALWRIGAGWWAVVVLALPTLTIVLALLLGDRLVPLSLGGLADEIGGFLLGFLLVNLWEEASWAGFMQTRLEQRHNRYVAAALTAIPFAGIHMPLQVINGVTAPLQLLAGFALLSVLAIVVRSYFGLVMRGTGGSLLAVGVAHTIFNRSNNTDGIAARVLEGGHRQVAALVATLVLTVVLGVVLRRRAAGRS